MTCKKCGKSFKPKAWNATFCSQRCSNLFHNAKMKDKRKNLYKELEKVKTGKLRWQLMRRKIGGNRELERAMKNALAFDL